MASNAPVQRDGGPDVPRKPIAGGTLLYILVGVLIVGVLLSLIASYLATSRTTATPGEVPASVPMKPQVTQFDHDLKQAGDVIHRNLENARKVAGLAEALHAQLPPCNEQMRTQLNGKYYVLVSNAVDEPDVNLVCQADDQWAVLPPSVSSVHETAEQTTAEQNAGGNGGLSPAEKRKMRRQLAFQSNPIPLHFADSASSATPVSAPATDGNIPPRSASVSPAEMSPSQRPGASSDGYQPDTATPGTQAGQTDMPPRQFEKVPAAVPLGVQLSGSVGPKYPIFEGRIIEGLLANRLMGQQGGVVKAQITTPVYSWDGQHLLIPPGALLLGEAARVNVAGRNRLAVVFHRIIMPDGYSFLLAGRPKGVDQQGAAGLTGKVNSHLASLIATAVMVGAIEGLADFADVGSGSAVVEIQGGVSREGSTEAMQIMRNALNRPPDVTVYEGTRVRVFVAEDQALPEYRNHVVTATLQ